MFRVLTALLVAAATISAVSPVAASDVRWPKRTTLPADRPPPTNPPSQLIRAPEAAQTAAPAIPHTICNANTMCVVCVANCADSPTPSVIHAQKVGLTATAPITTVVENDSDGVSANSPVYARPQWAGIVCGQKSGCIASGISAPPRPREYDVRITVINRYID